MMNYLRGITILTFAVLLTFAVVTVSKGQRIEQEEAATVESGKEIEKRLLETIRNEQLKQSDPDSFRRAIRRLGEIRSVAAIDDLIKLLSFRAHYPSDDDIDHTESHPIGLLGRYIAGSALSEIGEPALPALVKVIETHDCKDIESEVAGEAIIYAIKDYEKAPKFLRQAAADAPTAAAQCFYKLIEKAEKLERSWRELTPQSNQKP